MTTQKDHRLDQRVLTTFTIEDKHQDFLEIDLLENGVMLGSSIMFQQGRLTLVGIGGKDGLPYYTRTTVLQLRENVLDFEKDDLFFYMKETTSPDPLPWKADVLIYKITGQKPATNPDRFITNN